MESKVSAILGTLELQAKHDGTVLYPTNLPAGQRVELAPEIL